MFRIYHLLTLYLVTKILVTKLWNGHRKLNGTRGWLIRDSRRSCCFAAGRFRVQFFYSTSSTSRPIPGSGWINFAGTIRTWSRINPWVLCSFYESLNNAIFGCQRRSGQKSRRAVRCHACSIVSWLCVKGWWSSWPYLQF